MSANAAERLEHSFISGKEFEADMERAKDSGFGDVPFGEFD